MMISLHRLGVIASTLLLATAAQGQEGAPAPKTPPTAAQVVTENWTDIGRKIVAMAQDFPEDKYNFKPNPDVRTFAEQVLHAATGNVYLSKIGRGEKAKYVELTRDKYPSKADVVSIIKQSFDETTSLLKTQGDDQMRIHPGQWIGFLEHAGEHYGQLVVYYRLNGLVPPESRPKPKK